MLAKIKWMGGAAAALVVAVGLAGCSPAGPHALWKGKRLLDQGDLAGALPQFQRATALMATNATAWNYLGVALQRSGRPAEAAAAYQSALRCDHDLVEAHLNYGVLALENNQPDIARSELTAYTLRRPNAAAGWLELGRAQMQAGGSLLAAERSFSAVLALKTSEADAYNGLGLARLQEGKPHEAAQFFAAALQAQPNFPPALLNLATVNWVYLRDHKNALAQYQAYLALSPRPANHGEVQTLVTSLLQSETAPVIPVPPATPKTATPPSEMKAAPAVPPPTQTAPANHSEPTERLVGSETHSNHVVPAPNPVAKATPAPTSTPPPPVNPQPVKVAANPIIAAAPVTPPSSHSPESTLPPALPTGQPAAPHHNPTPLLAPLHSSPANGVPPGHKPGEEMNTGSGGPAANPASGNLPAETKTPPVSRFARYPYSAAAKPAAGDRHRAEAPFNLARLAEQDEKWAEAAQYYEQAAATDPSWFQAQYNAGFMAQRLHHYGQALPHFEAALALQPETAGVRYQFALALRAAGYPVDAAEELKKLLATTPNDVPAHLALGNLSAQVLQDVAQARQHYLRVLELQPDHPEANNIRFWLSNR